jgi:hypothetical protein
MTLLHKKITVAKSKEVKTGWSNSQWNRQVLQDLVCDSKRDVLLVVIIQSCFTLKMTAAVSATLKILINLFPVVEVMHYSMHMVQLVAALNEHQQQHNKIALLFYSS